jgi:two-component system LytT family response regulator
MSRFRILIVDDESLSRTRLRRMISLDPECELLGECSNGSEAVAAHGQLHPDIVFLDVQMPGMDGFEVLRAIAGSHPLVILTSAHGEHALRAFEADVFDYLLKPFGRRRFCESLQRAKSRITCDRARVPGAAQQPAHSRQFADRIAVRNNGSVTFVKLEEIDWFEAADNYVVLHRGRETHLVRATMAELEVKLDPGLFLRVHRSAIVNLDRIKELRRWFRGEYLIVLRDGTELTLTKNHRENLESRLLLGAA